MSPLSVLPYDRLAELITPGRITVQRPGDWSGPAAVFGHLLPRILASTTMVTAAAPGDDAAARAAELFARGARHGGYPTDRGFTWNPVTSYLLGASTPEALAAAAADIDPAAAVAAHIAGDDDGALQLTLTRGGRPVTEDTGIAALRARVATGKSAHPLAAGYLGPLIDRRPATSTR